MKSKGDFWGYVFFAVGSNEKWLWLLGAELGVVHREYRKKHIWKKGKENFHFDSQWFRG
jgi:hypothetical protein